MHVHAHADAIARVVAGARGVAAAGRHVLADAFGHRAHVVTGGNDGPVARQQLQSVGAVARQQLGM